MNTVLSCGRSNYLLISFTNIVVDEKLDTSKISMKGMQKEKKNNILNPEVCIEIVR